MKNRLLTFVSLVLVSAIAFVTFAHAQEARVGDSANLLISNGTADCIVMLYGHNTSDIFNVRITLSGTNVDKVWERQETGQIFFFRENNTPLVSGEYYTLTVNYSINGIPQAPLTDSRTCP